MGPRILLSSTLIVAGAALVAGGPTIFPTAISLIWRYLPALLFAVAGVLALTAVVPQRALILPATLASLGLVVLLARTYSLALVARFGGGAALAVIGMMLAMRLPRPVNLRRRRWALVSNRNLEPVEAPARIRLVAAGGGKLTVDLAGARFQNKHIQLFLSTWYGEIDLRFPEKWVLVAGRVAAVRGVTFSGQLDRTQGFEDPDGSDKEALDRLLGEGKPSTDQRPCVAVIHVVGVGGRVSVARGKR
jgi:hypothetical protein